MPQLDRTGPQGKGPQTGRGQGPCRGDDQNMIRRFFSRRGGRRGYGLGANRPLALEAEEKMLRERLAEIEQAKKDQS
jgi:hypothetical protein